MSLMLCPAFLGIMSLFLMLVGLDVCESFSRFFQKVHYPALRTHVILDSTIVGMQIVLFIVHLKLVCLQFVFTA